MAACRVEITALIGLISETFTISCVLQISESLLLGAGIDGQLTLLGHQCLLCIGGGLVLGVRIELFDDAVEVRDGIAEVLPGTAGLATLDVTHRLLVRSYRSLHIRTGGRFCSQCLHLGEFRGVLSDLGLHCFHLSSETFGFLDHTLEFSLGTSGGGASLLGVSVLQIFLGAADQFDGGLQICRLVSIRSGILGRNHQLIDLGQHSLDLLDQFWAAG